MGNAGEGNNWHHIVEQHAGNLKRFSAEALHNTENVRDEFVAGGMVVREWLRTQSYEQQRAFGLEVLRKFGGIP